MGVIISFIFMFHYYYYFFFEIEISLMCPVMLPVRLHAFVYNLCQSHYVCVVLLIYLLRYYN